jgi:hypothetical protein
MPLSDECQKQTAASRRTRLCRARKCHQPSHRNGVLGERAVVQWRNVRFSIRRATVARVSCSVCSWTRPHRGQLSASCESTGAGRRCSSRADKESALRALSVSVSPSPCAARRDVDGGPGSAGEIAAKGPDADGRQAQRQRPTRPAAMITNSGGWVCRLVSVRQQQQQRTAALKQARVAGRPSACAAGGGEQGAHAAKRLFPHGLPATKPGPLSSPQRDCPCLSLVGPRPRRRPLSVAGTGRL